MKRLLAFLLVLTLLAGCTVNTPTEPTQPTEPPTTGTTVPPAPSLYDAQSAVEQQTAGAVRAYPLDGRYDGFFLLGNQIVVFSVDEQVQMKSFSGETLRLERTVTHHVQIPNKGEDLQIHGDMVCYYNRGVNTLVVLDRQLREKYLVELPENMQGTPVINREMDTVYFCTDEGIRALNLETGIARLLRQQDNYSGKLYGSCFDGNLLCCTMTAPDSSTYTEFISADTGLQEDQDPGIIWIETYQNRYLLRHGSEETEAYLFGQRDGEVFEFQPPEEERGIVPALELGGVLIARDLGEDYALDLYDLDSGKRTASVTVAGLNNVRSLICDAAGFVWFLGDDDVLYRWDPDKSAVTDETVYTCPWYTNDAPNETGLIQCQEAADTIGETYGVQIRLWKDAVTGPWEQMTAEFRVPVFLQALEELELVLAEFPEDMLEQMGSICDNDALVISLVADTGTLQGQQTWYDGDAHLAVEMGDSLRTELLRTIYRVMDTYVLGENSMLDDWDAERPAEDRTRYFLEAMTGDNAEFFEDYSTQRNLRTLCRAIRRAFGMRYYDTELPWEQYLDDPLY